MAPAGTVRDNPPVTGKFVPEAQAVVRQDFADPAREMIDQGVYFKMPAKGRRQLKREMSHVHRFATYGSRRQRGPGVDPIRW